MGPGRAGCYGRQRGGATDAGADWCCHLSAHCQLQFILRVLHDLPGFLSFNRQRQTIDRHGWIGTIWHRTLRLSPSVEVELILRTMSPSWKTELLPVALLPLPSRSINARFVNSFRYSRDPRITPKSITVQSQTPFKKSVISALSFLSSLV